jgi:transcriptional regulator with XRE-family HTH domain
MNRVVTPNMASIIATDEFIRIVKDEMEKQNLTKTQIARVAHVSRKTVYAWLNGTNAPRLDSVAQILAALGYQEIRLPLTIREEETE